MNTPTFAALALTSLLGLAGCAAQPTPEPLYYQVATRKPYADVLAELELAITERNFRITGHNKIGSVIRERDGVAGFPDYDSLQFCNLGLARHMLEAAPESVIQMPCTVATRAQDGRVYISTRLLPTDSGKPALDRFARDMNQQLKDIVDFAAEP